MIAEQGLCEAAGVESIWRAAAAHRTARVPRSVGQPDLGQTHGRTPLSVTIIDHIFSSKNELLTCLKIQSTWDI